MDKLKCEKNLGYTHERKYYNNVKSSALGGFIVIFMMYIEYFI